MDESQQKALAVYLVVTAAVGWFGHNSVAEPVKARRRNIQKDVDDLKAKKTAYEAAKKQAVEETAKRDSIKADLNGMLDRFVPPKGRQGERNTKFYDTFSLSEQVSAAAAGLVLNPKDPLDPDHLLYQSTIVQEEDLVAKGASLTDPNNKPSLESGKDHVYNFLGIDQIKFKYTVNGDFASFISFLDQLGHQKALLDVTSLDVYQKGASGTTVSAAIQVSALDVSDGLVNPAAGP